MGLNIDWGKTKSVEEEKLVQDITIGNCVIDGDGDCWIRINYGFLLVEEGVVPSLHTVEEFKDEYGGLVVERDVDVTLTVGE